MINSRTLNDADWGEYSLGGKLLGSQWDFPNGETNEIKCLTVETEKADNMTLKYPQIEFEHGYEERVSAFKTRIDSQLIGDIEPSCDAANEIIRII